MARTGRWCIGVLMVLACGGTGSAAAATIYVAAGANLQTALNAAQPGDTILLEEGAEFVGNFVLPVKNGDGWITVRTSAPDSLLPPMGVRINPSHAPLLARLRSSNASAVLRTAPGAHHWDLRYLEFGPNRQGYGDILLIGDGTSVQNTLDKVPHHFILNHIYLHGDPAFGQKRGISLHAAHVTISDSYISDCKGVGLDTQAIAGWNGPGPYLIENNYLEGAGENIMFGGADPSITGMVADGVTFRRNYVSRPMSWRDPILDTPQAAASAEAGGSLEPGLYGYRVVARGPVGLGVTARSTASAEVSAQVLASGGAVRIQWPPVAGATEYRVYGRTAGAQATYWTTTATHLVDTGQAGTAEAVPKTAGTVWSVKNLFELKNARNVVVEHNVFENHWKDAQAGYSILFTPRNSNGTCSWCGVENVRFEYNVVRNVAAGINILGYDDPIRPSRQTRGLVIRHNLFQQMTTALGGNGFFMLIGNGPRDITVEHNTVESNGETAVAVYGGTSTDPAEVYGFVMVANASRHGLYGMHGTYFTYGNAILSAYYPDAVFVANYLAGGSATKYPAGNLFAGVFADQFVDPARGDFTVRITSPLKSAAPDGSDVGVNFAQLMANLKGVVAGTPPNTSATPPSASFTTACAGLDCTFSDGSRSGSSPIATVAWNYGDGQTGTQTQHTYAAAGTYTVSLTVTDLNGLSATASAPVTVEPPAVPCSYAVSPASQSVAAAGGSGSFSVTAAAGCSWTAGSGASWITVTGGSNGSGNGTVAFSAAANTTTSSRTGTIAVGGQAFTISQDAAPSCSYSLSPTSHAVAASGGTGSFSVSTAAGCSWTAASGASWITVTSGASGTGNGTVAFSAAANTTTSSRSGTITAGGKTFTISQPAASSCSYSLSPASQSVAAGGDSGSFSVAATAGCTWTASSGASWITVTSGASGSGNGTVAFSAATNGTTTSRTGTITAGGQTFTINQAANSTACSYAISPASVSMSAFGGSNLVTLTASAGCRWTATSNASWLSIVSSGSGTGSSTVYFNVQANSGSARTGTLTIAGRTFTVSQSAPPCSYTVTPSSVSLPASGGTGTVSVSTQSGCTWSSATLTSWITVSGSGTASGSVTYTVAANTSSTSRTGAILVAGRTVSFTQAAATGTISAVSPPANLRVVVGP